jgi:CubicO group peptidase (beta-lactamase class C family)
MIEISEAIPRVDQIFQAFHDRRMAPGLAYGVLVDGRLVHSGGFGSTGAVTTGGNPVHPPDADSVFRIASMTKSFTASAILLLRDRGRLGLDDPVSVHVPELCGLVLPTADSPALTIRHLLTMSGGLPTDDAWGDRQESLDPHGFSALLTNGFRFVTAPGTAFEYSNLGYAILGRVIGSIAAGSDDGARETGGRTAYHRFVETELLAPLGLAATSYDVADVAPDRLMAGHRRVTDGWVGEPFDRPGAFSAMGGLFSSVRDLSRWVGGFLDAFPPRDDAEDQHPLCRASRREMQQHHRFATVAADVRVGATSPGRTARSALSAGSSGYGFGLIAEHFTDRGEVISHSGGYPGFGSHMRWHPATGLAVIALANSTYAGPADAATQALNALLDQAGRPNRPVTPWPDTVQAAAQVDELLSGVGSDAGFDHALADRLFAENVDLDQPRGERVAALAAGAERIGVIDRSRPLELTSDGPAHATWSRPAAAGVQTVTIRLSPEASVRVQTLTVHARSAPPPQVSQLVARLIAVLNSPDPGWPDDMATGPAFDRERFGYAARLASALGGPFELAERPADAGGGTPWVFGVQSPALSWQLSLEFADEANAVVASCTLAPVAVSAG